MKIVLYTTHCPVCKGIERMLKKSGKEYEEVSDTRILEEKGYTHPPVLEVEGIKYEGKEISDFILKGIQK